MPSCCRVYMVRRGRMGRLAREDVSQSGRGGAGLYSGCMRKAAGKVRGGEAVPCRPYGGNLVPAPVGETPRTAAAKPVKRRWLNDPGRGVVVSVQRVQIKRRRTAATASGRRCGASAARRRRVRLLPPRKVLEVQRGSVARPRYPCRQYITWQQKRWQCRVKP